MKLFNIFTFLIALLLTLVSPVFGEETQTNSSYMQLIINFNCAVAESYYVCPHSSYSPQLIIQDYFAQSDDTYSSSVSILSDDGNIRLVDVTVKRNRDGGIVYRIRPTMPSVYSVYSVNSIRTIWVSNPSSPQDEDRDTCTLTQLEPATFESSLDWESVKQAYFTKFPFDFIGVGYQFPGASSECPVFQFLERRYPLCIMIQIIDTLKYVVLLKMGLRAFFSI